MKLSFSRSLWCLSSFTLAGLVLAIAAIGFLQDRFVLAQSPEQSGLLPRVQGTRTLNLQSGTVIMGQRAADNRPAFGPPASPNGTVLQTPSPAPGLYSSPNYPTYQVPAIIAGQRNPQDAQQAADALKALQADADDQAARELLSEILDKQFEQDLEHRKQQIEGLQAQIDALKEQVAKREKARERIIELRIELMINEADGLGFPSSWSQWPVWSQPTGTYAPAIGLGYSTAPATVAPSPMTTEQNSNRSYSTAPAMAPPNSSTTNPNPNRGGSSR